MANIKFNVPGHIKEAFEEAIAKEDRNATISRLMQEAVNERRRQQQRAAAIEALLDLRKHQSPMASEEQLADVPPVGPEHSETFTLAPEAESALLASIEEADRGETVSAEELFRALGRD